MDSALLASGAVSALVAFFTRAAEGAAEGVGESLGSRLLTEARQLYGVVRAQLRGSDLKTAALERLEAEPEDVKGQGALEFILEAEILRDEEFATALSGHLARLERWTRIDEASVAQSGFVAMGGNVDISGAHVAGRDMTVHHRMSDDV